MGAMRKPTRTRRREVVSSPTLARWGGAAACLAGVSYGALGYLDDPDTPEILFGTVVPVLKLTTPASFLGGLVGLYSRLGGGGSPLLARAGLLVACSEPCWAW